MEKEEVKTIRRIVFIIAAVIFFIVLFSIINNSNLTHEMSNIFKDNLDGISLWQLKGNIGGGIVFSIYVTIFFFCVLGVINPRKFNMPLLFTIGFITFVIISGLFIVRDLMGTKEIDFYLNPLGFGLGRIVCSSESNIILAGELVSCNLKDSIIKNYESINVSFTYANLNKSSIILNETSKTFIAPEKVRYISFELLDPYISDVSTGYPHHFKTFEEYEKDKPIFLAYILSLILLAFVTIPSAVLNIRKLILIEKINY